MTLLIELTGLLILFVFIVIPVQEFRQILTKLRRQGDLPPATGDELNSAGHSGGGGQ